MVPSKSSWFFMVPGWFFMVPGCFSLFFMVQGWFFMVPGRFLMVLDWISWFFMVPDWFFKVPGWFLWFFMVPGLFSCFCHGFRLIFHDSRSALMVFYGSRLDFHGVSPKCTRPNCILARRSSLGPPPRGLGPSGLNDRIPCHFHSWEKLQTLFSGSWQLFRYM